MLIKPILFCGVVVAVAFVHVSRFENQLPHHYERKNHVQSNISRQKRNKRKKKTEVTSKLFPVKLVTHIVQHLWLNTMHDVEPCVTSLSRENNWLAPFNKPATRGNLLNGMTHCSLQLSKTITKTLVRQELKHLLINTEMLNRVACSRVLRRDAKESSI